MFFSILLFLYGCKGQDEESRDASRQDTDISDFSKDAGEVTLTAGFVVEAVELPREIKGIYNRLVRTGQGFRLSDSKGQDMISTDSGQPFHYDTATQQILIDKLAQGAYFGDMAVSVDGTRLVNDLSFNDQITVHNIYLLTKDGRAFRADHPEMRVNYEVGVTRDNAVTSDDAHKNLSTEILAGKGPNVNGGFSLNPYSSK